jgi:membrane protease YdiL (CAAX protease family)
MSEFNNNFEENKTAKYRLDKKMLSRAGFALLAVFFIDLALEIGASVIFSTFLPNVYKSVYFSACAKIVCNYLIAIPIGILILRTMIKPIEERENKKLGAGALVLWVSVAMAAMFIGSKLGSTVNSLIEKAIGRGSHSGLDAITSIFPLWLTFVLMVVAAPIAEEFLFRRGLTEALRPWGWKLAVLTSGLFFGLYHGNLEQFFYASFMGILLGYVYLYTGKVRYSIFLHMAVNFIVGFIPTVINRFSYTLAEAERFSAALEAYSAAAATAASPKDIPTEIMQELFGSMAKILPGMTLSLLYNALVFGLVIAGVIVAIRMWRKLSFKAAERKIERKCLGDTVFLAPGVLAFIVVMLVMMARGIVFA